MKLSELMHHLTPGRDTARSTVQKSPSQNGQLVTAVLSSLIADSWEGKPMNIALALMVVVVGLFLVNIMGAKD